MRRIAFVTSLMISSVSCRPPSSSISAAKSQPLRSSADAQTHTHRKKKRRRKKSERPIEDNADNATSTSTILDVSESVIKDIEEGLLIVDDGVEDGCDDYRIEDTHQYPDATDSTYIDDGGVLLPIDDSIDEESMSDEKITQPIMQESESTSEKSMDYSSELLEAAQDDEISPTINVTRNETSESMNFRDDSDPLVPPTTYSYTKHSEEERVEEMHPVVQSTVEDGEDNMMIDDEAAQNTPIIKASTQTSKQYENIQLVEGGQTISVKISRQHKEQTVHITSKDRAAATTTITKKRKKSSSLQKPKSTAASTATTGKGNDCLRRIKREWKDAVKTGIAYDWTNMRTIQSKKRQNIISNNSNSDVRIGPFGKNLLRWHFSIAGPASSSYENGIYHGRVLLPKNYPGSPPRVQMLTPSGRFVCGADICLSASNYHPETWSPRWTVISLVNALRLHMLTTANEIGGVQASDDRRREYAIASRTWIYPGVVNHGKMVQDGIFPLGGANKEDDDNDSQEQLEELHENAKPTISEQQPKIDVTMVDTNTVDSGEPNKRSKAVKKEKSSNRNTGKTNNMNENGRSNRIDTSSSKQAAITKKEKTRSNDNEDRHELLPMLIIKRIATEILKLVIVLKLLDIMSSLLQLLIK